MKALKDKTGVFHRHFVYVDYNVPIDTDRDIPTELKIKA